METPSGAAPGHFGKDVIGEAAVAAEAEIVEKAEHIFGKAVLEDLPELHAGAISHVGEGVNVAASEVVKTKAQAKKIDKAALELPEPWQVHELAGDVYELYAPGEQPMRVSGEKGLATAVKALNAYRSAPEGGKQPEPVKAQEPVTEDAGDPLAGHMMSTEAGTVTLAEYLEAGDPENAGMSIEKLEVLLKESPEARYSVLAGELKRDPKPRIGALQALGESFNEEEPFASLIKAKLAG